LQSLVANSQSSLEDTKNSITGSLRLKAACDAVLDVSNSRHIETPTKLTHQRSGRR